MKLTEAPPCTQSMSTSESPSTSRLLRRDRGSMRNASLILT